MVPQAIDLDSALYEDPMGLNLLCSPLVSLAPLGPDRKLARYNGFNGVAQTHLSLAFQLADQDIR